MLLVLLASLAGSFSIAVSTMPQLQSDLSNITVAEGKDASFTCSVSNLGGHRVAWIKSDSKAVLAIHDHVITNNDKISVTQNDKDTWTLKIKSVSQDDAGSYMCQINSSPMIERRGSLTVIVPPTILDSLSTTSVSVNEGSHATLTCEANGNPHPTIEWRRLKSRGQTAKEEQLWQKMFGTRLVLKNVTRHEMGKYLCIAKNGVAPAKSKTMSVFVNFEPEVVVENSILGAPLGSSVRITCSVEAFPQAIVYWTNEKGEMIVGSDTKKVREKTVSPFRIITSLLIGQIGPGDFQRYTCVAKNTLGKSSGNIDLFETKLPTTSTVDVFRLTTVTLNDLEEPRREPKDDQMPKLIGYFDEPIENTDSSGSAEGSKFDNGRKRTYFGGSNSCSRHNQSRMTLLSLLAFVRLFNKRK